MLILSAAAFPQPYSYKKEDCKEKRRVCRKVPSTLGLESMENQPKVWRSGSGILEPPPHLWKCTPSHPHRGSPTTAVSVPLLLGVFCFVCLFFKPVLLYANFNFKIQWLILYIPHGLWNRIQVHKMFRKHDPSFFTCCPWNDCWKFSHQNLLQSWDTEVCSPANKWWSTQPDAGTRNTPAIRLGSNQAHCSLISQYFPLSKVRSLMMTSKGTWEN